MTATRKTSIPADEKGVTKLADRIADAAQDGGTALKRGAEDLADAAKDRARDAGTTLATVRDAAVEKADAARETLSEVGERIAATLQRASDTEDADALKARVFNSVADGLTRASTTLRQRSVTDLTDDVRTLARRHPGAFMAAAAVVGFATARFLRSSAERRTDRARIDARRDHRA